MIHDPDILILDEPTVGLDPIQIRDVRSLIRELGEKHTILLSTHIMPEVEAVCGRVIMIEKGRLVLDDQLDNLRAENAIILEARGPVDAIRGSLQNAPGVERVRLTGKNGEFAAFEVQTQNGTDLREALGTRLSSQGWPLRQLDLRRTTLEDRFVQAVAQETLNPDDAREAV
jgi:ABC-2 type transport system ATP-binding protein